MKNISKGSVWRRWETHIHTPGTIKNDQFIGSNLDEKWEKYIDDINNYEDDIAVIAITDYLCIENYFRFKKAVDDKKITKAFDLILPNIELRISPVTGGETPINIHCIFNPSFDGKIVDRFYSKLKFHYQTRDYLATRSELVELGRKYKNDLGLDENLAYKEGIKIFVPPIDQLKKLLEDDTELRENCIVLVSNKSNDGVSGLNAHAEMLEGVRHNTLDATRQTIYYLCDGIYSSNEKDIKYFLGKGIDEAREVKRKCKSLKPCLHGSDAHKNDKIFEPDNKKYCWIKSDPTFEGFRQIIFEPFSRVRIQEDRPEQKQPYLTIDKVNFVAADNKFAAVQIELNDKLNSIIGGKSSGKSLLLYYIAKTIDPVQVSRRLKEMKIDEPYEFEKENGFGFEVHWCDATKYSLNDGQERKRQITFIPQMYINHIAEHKGDKELDKLVQSILNEQEDLRRFFEEQKTSISNAKVDAASQVIKFFRYKESIKEKDEAIRVKGDKDARQRNLEQKQDELSALRIESNFSEEDELAFSLANNGRQINEQRLARLRTLQAFLQNDYTNTIASIKSDSNNSFNSLLTLIQSRFNSDSLIVSVLKNMLSRHNGSATIVFETMLTEIRVLLEKVERVTTILEERVIYFNDRLLPYLQRITKREKLDQIQTVIKTEENELNQIAILELEKEGLVGLLNQTKSAIITDYARILSGYQRMAEKVNIEHAIISPEKEIRLKAAIGFDKDKFNQSCTIHIDKRNYLSDAIGSYFDENNDYCFIEESHLENISHFFDKVLTNSVRFNQSGNTTTVCERMFDDYFSIHFELYEKGESIFKMSPGKKGLILMYLILHLSNATYPILIDQPEDNLDNRTVYSELKEFLKSKKIDRQILMVTHNANLVVPTDSENIIVANQSGQDSSKDNAVYQFEYVSGALENTFIDKSADGILQQMGIREHVCDILEGGEQAFKERELRYAIAQ